VAGVGVAGVGVASVGVASVGVAGVGVARVGVAGVGVAGVGVAGVGVAGVGVAGRDPATDVAGDWGREAVGVDGAVFCTLRGVADCDSVPLSRPISTSFVPETLRPRSLHTALS
jgi:hypothetical protein